MMMKKIFSLIAILIISMACSLVQSAMPEAQAATDPPAQTAAEEPAPAEVTQPAQDNAQPQSDESVPNELTYPIVDTGQIYCYDDSDGSQPCPEAGEVFYGQDAQYSGYAPSYTDNGDGTVTDNVTGLMWQQNPGAKMTYAQAVAGAESFTLAGYDDWRLPTIKELYSLILFSGYDVSGWNEGDTSGLIPFMDNAFAFEYGDTGAGERVIDSQWATDSIYANTIFGGQQAMFGVNFADGRIKGYPTGTGGGPSKTYFVIYVRGNSDYGINDFVDNGNGTIRDNATGLTWMQNDNGSSTGSEPGGMNWEDALNYCERLDYAGSDDWRLPNVKELQSIVDYSRSPDATNSAAIDPLFNISTIINEAGQTDYPAFWSSTTHANMLNGSGASYVSFGRATGYMNGQWMDVHGAGAQRSDPKSGDPTDWPTGNGPQGDAIRIENYVRCVTGGVSNEVFTGGEADPQIGEGSAAPGGGAQPGQEQNPSTGSPSTGSGGTPPQEAINACSGLSEGAACSFATQNDTVSGSCRQIQTQLACAPEGGPPAGGQP